MPPKRVSPSATPEQSTENAASAADGSALPAEQWTAMQDILDHVYDYRTADGYDPSKVFHRKVNKRAIPAYYEVIKEPIALSTIKQRLNNKEYRSFAGFVRDFALISHNAQVYNRPDAGAYQDALIVKEQLQKQLQMLVDRKLVLAEDATLPYLGEIPPQDEVVAEEEEEGEESDEDDEDDEADEELGEESVKRRKRGRPRRSSVAKREAALGKAEGKDDDPETRKKRGRPPKVLTPTEARITAVLKGIRKPRNNKGTSKISHFERLPDKNVMPEYFTEIKTPMAFDVLKRKLKRKKYNSLEQFMRDVELMFENAKQYNQDESQIYKDAVELQQHAQRLAETEAAKPDTDFVMDEGRIPMPDGILHNGELYKVGDWVLIQNANDLTKPIPTQIYRTWQDTQGGKWVNVCWYYRPEQTVHRFDKHFLDNEVVKTGQYRDHRIDEIVGRCFIMFVTRYFKGRPRNLPPDMEIFVCEARYNEEKLTFNKIKTWASCLPDEVRDKDYEMDLFDAPRRMKKFPSPIAYLLRDEQKETDDLPKPEWGAENAPPKIGAVHRRPRDSRDSPPPEPTPTPPPQPPPAPARSVPQMSSTNPQSTYSQLQSSASMQPQAPTQSPARPMAPARTSFTPSHPQQYAPSHSPGPAQAQRPFAGQRPSFPSTALQMTPLAASRPPTQPQAFPSQPAAPTNPYLRPDQSNSASYRGPPPIEVYTLPDNANASIPAEIRSQFQQDEQGRVLFFTAPPVYLSQADEPTTRNASSTAVASTANKAPPGHSISYTARKIRTAAAVAERRKEHETRKAEAQALKRKKRSEEDEQTREELGRVKRRALQVLEGEMADAVRKGMQGLYGDEWTEMMEQDVDDLGAMQRVEDQKWRAVKANERRRERAKWVPLAGSGTFLDE